MAYKKIKEPKGMMVDGEEAIPAAVYEPSDSSDDFQIQVERALGDEAESSKAHENVWLARCELSHEVIQNNGSHETITNGFCLNEIESQSDSSNKLVTILPTPLEGKTVEEMDLTNLVNPTEKMLEAREERRWSKRVLKITEEAELAKMTSEKGPCEGNNMLSKSFSILGNEEPIDRSIAMGVKTDKDNFANINIATEMEKAGQALHCKARNLNKEDTENNCSDTDPEEQDTSGYELNHVTNGNEKESTSDSASSTLVLFKRERKAPKRLFLSGKKKQ
jgi:hypothetical protein